MKKIAELLSRCGHKVAVVLMSLMMFATFTVANPNQADAGFEVGVAAGWDDMLLDSEFMKSTNSGFVGTISLGFRFIDLVGLYYEQDLGYIQPKLKGKILDTDVTVKGDKYFKGASLASVRVYIPITLIELSIRVGLGTMYMDTSTDWQKWFAFRPGIGLAAKLGSLRIGGEFDYTLAAADRNTWDKEKKTHFLSVKGFVSWVF